MDDKRDGHGRFKKGHVPWIKGKKLAKLSPKEYKKEYYKKNKRYFKRKSKENYRENKESYIVRSKKWIEKNPSKRKNITAKYRERNKEILRKKSKEYYKMYRKNNLVKAKYREYIDGAKRRGLVFDLTLKEFKKFIESSCFYCGESKAGGIGRVDNTMGYLKDNSVSCCSRCNRMKFNYSLEDFIDHCRKVVDYSG